MRNCPVVLTDFILALMRNEIWCKAKEVRLVHTYAPEERGQTVGVPLILNEKGAMAP